MVKKYKVFIYIAASALIFLLGLIVGMFYIKIDWSVVSLSKLADNKILLLFVNVLAAISTLSAVLVSLRIASREERHRRIENMKKAKTIIYYLYIVSSSAEDAFKFFKKDFESLVYDNRSAISDLLYSIYSEMILTAISRVNEYGVSDMPNHNVLDAYIELKFNLEKVNVISNELYEFNNSNRCDDTFSFVSFKYQDKYKEMCKAIDTITSTTKILEDAMYVKA